MKKHIVTIFFLLALILSACGSTAGSTSSNELSAATKLIVGTFKLEGTQQAITSEEAKQLLPLWQVYSEMITSDTAAQEEIDGLVAQIQETMTSEQTQAIDGMGLTQRDIFAVMQEQGGATRSQMGSTTNGTSGNNRDFGPPGGGPPPGGDFFMGGGFQRQNSSSSQSSTSNSQNTQSDQSSRLTSRLLEVLISFLEKKAQQ
jgi:hypothetical protein